jgi:hypothetical protein
MRPLIARLGGVGGYADALIGDVRSLLASGRRRSSLIRLRSCEFIPVG